MKIITWNCNMAFRKKADFILKSNPDILVVPECEHPDKLKFTKGTPLPKDMFWYGTNYNKGLAVFSYSDFKIELIETHNPEIKTILPLRITNGKFNFILFAIWAYNPNDLYYKYIGQVWKAIEYYEKLIVEENVILIGDFNSNAIWDKLKRRISHSMVVEKLKTLNISSAYHEYLNQIQGQEIDPTYFMYRHQDKPYHIDYCFASANLMEKLTAVDVGAYEEWTMHSDHKPLSLTFEV